MSKKTNLHLIKKRYSSVVHTREKQVTWSRMLNSLAIRRRDLWFNGTSSLVSLRESLRVCLIREANPRGLFIKGVLKLRLSTGPGTPRTFIRPAADPEPPPHLLPLSHHCPLWPPPCLRRGRAPWIGLLGVAVQQYLKGCTPGLECGSSSESNTSSWQTSQWNSHQHVPPPNTSCHHASHQHAPCWRWESPFVVCTKISFVFV